MLEMMVCYVPEHEDLVMGLDIDIKLRWLVKEWFFIANLRQQLSLPPCPCFWRSMNLPVSNMRVLVFWLCLPASQVQRPCGVWSRTTRLGSSPGIAARRGPSKITACPSSSGDFVRMHAPAEGCLERSRERWPNIHISGRAKTRIIKSWNMQLTPPWCSLKVSAGRQISFSISVTRPVVRVR